MDELRIELDSVRKYRNKHEWRPVNRASCGDASVTGDGELIAPLCRLLMDQGEPGDRSVSVWRGKTPIFYAKPLSVWAGGKALKAAQPDALRRATNKPVNQDVGY